MKRRRNSILLTLNFKQTNIERLLVTGLLIGKRLINFLDDEVLK